MQQSLARAGEFQPQHTATQSTRVAQADRWAHSASKSESINHLQGCPRRLGFKVVREILFVGLN